MDKKQKMVAFALTATAEAMRSGMPWPEAAKALGLTIKNLALQAEQFGEGSREECLDLARKSFEEGFLQDVKVQVVPAYSDAFIGQSPDSSVTVLRRVDLHATFAEANAGKALLLATASNTTH